MADIKNFGIKGIAADVQMGKSGGRLKYDSGNGRFDLTQSDGSTLEDVRFGTVGAGTWQGTVIGSTYGGLGGDFSSSTGVLKISSGSVSAAAVDLTADVTGTLPVANGGTGATSAGDARTALGLGNIATQASNNVNIDGGAIDGAVIGANSAAAITGTTITASSGFVGNLTGTADDADALSSAVTVALSGDATGSATFTNAGDTATIATTLAASGVSAGSYGSSSAIPVITVDAKGRVTAVSTASTSSTLTIAADSGSNDTVTVGTDTLTFAGTSNEIETTVSDNQIQIGLPNDVTIGNNLSVTGSFLSDDITASTVTISGDGIITGNLTVQGTQTIVNSTTVETADAIFRVNSNGTTGANVGFEANVGGSIKQIVYTPSNVWSFGGESITSVNGLTATGTVTGGTLTDGTLSINGGSITGGVAGTFSGAVTGGSLTDGTLTASSGAITGATNITASGIVSFGTLTDSGESIAVTKFVDEADGIGSNDNDTSIPTSAAVKDYVDTALTGSDLDFQGDSGGALSIDLDSETLTIAGGTGISSVGSGNSLTLNLDDTAVSAGSYGSTTAVPVITVDAQGRITAASTATIATSFDIGADSGSDDTVNGGEKLTIAGTSNEIETAVTNNQIQIGLVESPQVGNITATGTVQGGTVTDGTLSIASGSISSGVGATFSGTVQGGTLTDGTLSASSGAITGATNITASGTVQYGSLSDGTITITGFVDEDNMASDSATLVPTQQSVKAYVDSVATAADLDFQGDSGGALSIDLDSETLDIAGGTNITTVGSGNTLTVNLDATLSGLTSVTSTTLTDGTATLTGGALSGATTGAFSSDVTIGGNLTVSGTTTSVNSTNTTIADTLIELQSGLTGANPNDIGHIYERGSDGDNGFLGWDQSVDRFIAATTTATGSSTGDLSLTAADFEAAQLIGSSATISGAVSFGSLTDSGESITVTKFVDEGDGISNNDNDTTIPTSAAVKDYVDNNGGDGLILRSALTSGNDTIDIGTVPNVSGRTYYADKIVIKISTAFSGGSFNHILVKENGGSGNTLVASADADAATAGSYIIELDGDDTLTKNATVQVQFMQTDGSTAATTTAGAGVATVHYNYV